VTSALYGCIRLTGVSPLDLSFLEWTKLDQGNHIQTFDSENPKPFDYWHGGHSADTVKQIVSARNTMFTGFKIKTGHSDNQLTYLTHSIMSMRQDLETDLADSSFLDKMWFHVYPRLHGRFAISLDMASALSQFVLLSRDTLIYLTSFGDFRSYYLAWSTEQTLEHRLRTHFGQRFIYYRHLPLSNGVMVLQSQFLASKFSKWQTKLSDLLTMNALDVFLQRKTRSNLILDTSL
jgi:hypothetical protein